jgi:hypothetical protein
MNVAAKNLATSIVAALTLSGCYVVPVVGPEGKVQNYHYPLPPAGTPVAVAPAAFAVPGAGGSFPVVLNARLYPDNDLAAQTGVVTGTVANMMNGKGRFQLQYGNEILTGEATRVSNDERRGVASAYGSSGSFMSCEYQMNSPRQGAGACTFSNGARYRLHVGS